MDKLKRTYTVTDVNGYTWRGSHVSKGATIDVTDATAQEIEQLRRDAQGPNAKLSGPTE